jgi:hypothetical protein
MATKANPVVQVSRQTRVQAEYCYYCWIDDPSYDSDLTASGATLSFLVYKVRLCMHLYNDTRLDHHFVISTRVSTVDR